MSERIYECYTLVTRPIPAKTCLCLRARGYSVHALHRESLTHLQKALVSSLGPQNHCAEKARTKDPGYQSMLTVEEA